MKVYVVVISEYNALDDALSYKVEPYAWPDEESAEIHKKDLESSWHTGEFEMPGEERRAEIVELQIMPPIRKPF